MLGLFSIYPTFVEVFEYLTHREWIGISTIGAYGSQDGYQIVNFILMYYVGMYIRKNEKICRNLKTYTLFLLFGG